VDTEPPNPALQLTASRARSFGFDVILCGALAAAECQTVGPLCLSSTQKLMPVLQSLPW